MQISRVQKPCLLLPIIDYFSSPRNASFSLISHPFCLYISPFWIFFTYLLSIFLFLSTSSFLVHNFLLFSLRFSILPPQPLQIRFPKKGAGIAYFPICNPCLIFISFADCFPVFPRFFPVFSAFIFTVALTSSPANGMLKKKIWTQQFPD